MRVKQNIVANLANMTSVFTKTEGTYSKRKLKPYTWISHRGRNKPKNFQGPIGPLVLKNWGSSIYFRTRFGFSNLLHTSGIEMNQQFQGPFGPLVLTFCGPSPNFEGKWLEEPALFQLLISYFEKIQKFLLKLLVIKPNLKFAFLFLFLFFFFT